MKWCCFVAPRMGGSYTVFRRLREGLAQRGIDVRWMAAGPEAHQAQASPGGDDDEAAAGCVVGPPSPRRSEGGILTLSARAADPCGTVS